MAGSSEPAFYLSAKKGAIAQSPIYFLVILRQPLVFLVRLAAHVSNWCKSRIRPVVGRI